MFRFIAFCVCQKLHVHLKRRQMINKVAVVYFLSSMEESFTTPVPLLLITGLGAHLMLFTVDSGLIVVRNH